MKNLYPKRKGKIHPSPASSFGGGSGGVSPAGGDALAVLSLLPAAILALTVALGDEDKEVLAYLITRSIKDSGAAPGAAAGEERRRCLRPGGLHRPLFDCGCFDCYTSFWSRWDCSPARELIQQVIEDFDEHLASTERNAGAGGGRARRRDRKGSDRAEKGRKGKERIKKKKADEAEDTNLVAAASERKEDVTGEEKEAPKPEAATIEAEVVPEVAAAAAAEEEEDEEVGDPDVTAAQNGERRRGWPDVMGLFNLRWWSLWNPGV